MKKILLALLIAITVSVSAFGATSNDIPQSVYLRQDVFEAKMDAFMAEIKLMNQNMRSELKQDINELSKAVSVLSTRIDGLDARIDGTNTRIDDLRNGLYLWLVAIGTFIAWPKAKEFLQSRKTNKPNFTLQDVEILVTKIIDAKLNSKSQS